MGSLASGFCFEERIVWFSEPFKLWALFCLVFWFFSGPRLGGGCIVTMTLFFDDKSRMTGATGMFVFTVMYVLCVFLFRLTRGHCPHNDAVSTFSPRYGSASRSPPFTRRGFPQSFCFFFGSSSPSGAFFLSSGWVGFPLPCFPLPPPLLALLSSGWVGSPCRVFPVVSPWFLGGWGVVLCVFCFSCYLLLLASLSLLQLGQHGLPTRKPPGPPRPFPWCVGPDPSPAGSRRSDAPGLRAGG